NDGGGLGVQVGEQTVQLDDAAKARMHLMSGMVGKDVAFGIRPEALGGDGTGKIDVHVELTEMLGSELLVHGTVGAPAVRAIDTGIELSDKPDSMIIASLDP